MSAKPTVLLISQNEFSGVVPALAAALVRSGCRVIEEQQSLRVLGPVQRALYGVWMTVSARLHYGRDAALMADRTRAAFVARSRANKELVDRHPEATLVLQITANFDTYRGPRPAGKRFVIYTDHMNLMSKHLPATPGFVLHERKPAPEWNRIEHEILHAQDHIVVMGSHVKPAIEALYDMPPSRVTVIGTGPGNDLDIVRDGGTKDASGKSILFVGKLAGVKGLGVLLEAFELVRAQVPDAVLHVVTRREVSAPGVVHHGAIDAAQLKKLFYSASIFSMPAYKEPLGLVYLEAMLAGCACVGTDTGAMPELIRDGETGYVVPVGDSAALAARLVAMLQDPARTRLMGERGYESVREYWDWDAVVGRLLAAVA